MYETSCNYNSSEENSFGFGCWTFEGANDYGRLTHTNHIIIKVYTPLNSICLIESTGKIRSSKMIIYDLTPC